MTTRIHAADGQYVDVDEETEAVGYTHVNDSPVIRTEWLGPTPPKPDKPAVAVDPAVRRAELLAELDALNAS